jgi:hypothetical protein
MSDTTVIKTIAKVERHQQLTRNGNPTHTIIFTDGTAAKTAPDSMINYEITNRENIGVPVQVRSDAQGVYDVRPVENG